VPNFYSLSLEMRMEEKRNRPKSDEGTFQVHLALREMLTQHQM
jgi:hypothetical protein